MERLLLDTNILIDHLRGDSIATALLRDVETGRVRASISVITEAEVLASPHLSRPAMRQVETLLSLLPSMAITPRIARAAARLCREHRMDLPDALIAATAILAHATLVTRNVKHFHALKPLRLRPLPHERHSA